MERIGSLVVTASTRTWAPDRNSWKDLVGKWPCYCTFTDQDDASRDEAKRLWSYSVRAWPNGNARKTSKWPSRWTFTGQDQSIELQMKLISSAVVELQCLQFVTDGGTKGQMDWGTGGDYFIVALTFLLKGGRTKMHAVHIHCDQNAIYVPVQTKILKIGISWFNFYPMYKARHSNITSLYNSYSHLE